MEKIIISACLVGDKCRYDGRGNYSPLVEKLKEKYELILVCPEVMGGLKTPRIPSEIKGDRVINQKGVDVTKYFDAGVDYATAIVKYLGIKKAVLKENSPSCGVHQVYDGSFKNKKIDGEGWLTKKLLQLNVKVYSEEEIEQLL